MENTENIVKYIWNLIKRYRRSLENVLDKKIE